MEGKEGYQARGLHAAAQSCGTKIISAGSVDQLIDRVDCLAPYCVVVLCTAQLGRETLETAERIRRIDSGCPLLVLSSSVSFDAVCCAMRSGISDVIDPDAPAETTIAALKRLSHNHPNRAKHECEHGDLVCGDQMVGHGAVAVGIRSQISRIAASDANVLITGESGTGKELAAQLIHRNSRRRTSTFVAVNCAAVPESLLEAELFGHERGAFTGAATARDGKLQYASGGTLFLDEIGDMPPVSQAKILRALESRVIQRLGSNVDTPVMFRVVSATNQDLEILTLQKKFRQDLYFRVNVVRLDLPPLRERAEDIPELAEHILHELSQRHKEPVRRLEGDVIRRLQRHHWPGNIRELRNVLETILVFSSSRTIGLADVPVQTRQSLSSSAPNYDNERSRIVRALSSADGNRQKASEILHCSRMTLYRKMVKYSIASSRS
jgi:DNA-binding NtrC family response regulator